jgi:hypothetical protein
MKKIFILTAGIALALWTCKPDTKGELGEPANKLDGMAGSWEIVSFKQQDPNNPIREERDLSEFYLVDGQTPYRLTFNKDSMTYAVAAGPGKNYFGTGGRWRSIMLIIRPTCTSTLQRTPWKHCWAVWFVHPTVN